MDINDISMQHVFYQESGSETILAEVSFVPFFMADMTANPDPDFAHAL